MSKIFNIILLIAVAAFIGIFVVIPLAIGVGNRDFSGVWVWLIIIGVAAVIVNWGRLFKK